MIASAKPAESPSPLLAVTWIDVSALPLVPGESMTADEELANMLYDMWVENYRDQVAQLMADNPGTGDPFNLAVDQQFRDTTAPISTERLQQYQSRLETFLATKPSEDDLVGWLSNRATQDAANWARYDGLDVRRRATDDFYRHNKLVPGRYRISPDTAAEPICRAVAGSTYSSYGEAADVLGSVWHPGCIHYIERISNAA